MIYEKNFKPVGVIRRIQLSPYREIQLEIQLEMPIIRYQNPHQVTDVDPSETSSKVDEVIISMEADDSQGQDCLIDFKDTYSW